MSYDITLAARLPGQDWDDALRAADPAPERMPGTGRSEQLHVWSQIEQRLRAALPGEIDVVTSADPSDGCVAELSVLYTGLQVALYPAQASVSFPYWDQDDPEDFHRQVAEAVRVVAEETGYAAYDHQTGDDFDGVVDDGPGLALTRQLAAEAGGTGVQAPGWYSGRRRAGTYLVIGAVVTPIALWLLVSGNGGPLSWVALAIGVVDLVVGGLSWVRSSRHQ